MYYPNADMHGQHHWDKSHILIGTRRLTEDLYMFEETFCCTTCGRVDAVSCLVNARPLSHACLLQSPEAQK